MPRADQAFRGVLPGVSVCDLYTSKTGRPRPDLGCSTTEKKSTVVMCHFRSGLFELSVFVVDCSDSLLLAIMDMTLFSSLSQFLSTNLV